MTTSLTPYRRPTSSVRPLRLVGELPVFNAEARCRKCGYDRAPFFRHEPARGWWFWRRPERIRRECYACRAVYYERPLDALISAEG